MTIAPLRPRRYTALAGKKSELTQQLIESEEDRLRIAQALIDVQVSSRQQPATWRDRPRS